MGILPARRLTHVGRIGMAMAAGLLGAATLAACGSAPAPTTEQASHRGDGLRRELRSTAPDAPRDSGPQRTRMVTVPNVVGEQEEAARNELEAVGFSVHFVWHSGPALICAGPAPGATVLSQTRRAGEKVPRNISIGLSASAYVQSGCGRVTASRVCNPSELALHVTEAMPEYTGGSEDSLVQVSVSHPRGTSPCVVTSPISLAIDQPRGTPADRVRGNPTTLGLHASLDPGQRMVAGWVLGSWCGSRDGVVAVAGLEGITATRSLEQLPYGQGPCPALGIYSLYKDSAYRD